MLREVLEQSIATSSSQQDDGLRVKIGETLGGTNIQSLIGEDQGQVNLCELAGEFTSED